jgi:hypothetical protein
VPGRLADFHCAGEVRPEALDGAGIVGKDVLQRRVELVGHGLRTPRRRGLGEPVLLGGRATVSPACSAGSAGASASARGSAARAADCARSPRRRNVPVRDECSCSSRIDCMSCGVITSDCDWRSCSLAVKRHFGTRRSVNSRPARHGPRGFPFAGRSNWPGSCLSSRAIAETAYRSVICE